MWRLLVLFGLAMACGCMARDIGIKTSGSPDPTGVWENEASPTAPARSNRMTVNRDGTIMIECNENGTPTFTYTGTWSMTNGNQMLTKMTDVRFHMNFTSHQQDEIRDPLRHRARDEIEIKGDRMTQKSFTPGRDSSWRRVR